MFCDIWSFDFGFKLVFQVDDGFIYGQVFDVFIIICFMGELEEEVVNC